MPFTRKGGKGLVEIAPLSAQTFLAVERFAAPGGFFAFELYLVRIETADDGFTLTKSPIDIPAFPSAQQLGNIEAMAIGPALDDEQGGRLLLFATDNNFGESAFGRETTDFHAFRLTTQVDPE